MRKPRWPTVLEIDGGMASRVRGYWTARLEGHTFGSASYLHKNLTYNTSHAFNRYPVLNTHQTITRQMSMNSSVMPRLIPRLTSDTP